MTLLMRDQENAEKGSILQKLPQKFLLSKRESQKYLSR